MRKVLIFFCYILLLASCRIESNKVEHVLTVKIDTVKPYLSDEVSNISGKICSTHDVNLAFRVSGTLLRTPFTKGSYVKEGSVLAEIDPRDYRLQLDATKAEYEQIKGDAERVIELYKKKSISKSDYDKAVYGLEQITAKYQSHKNALSDTRLLAPFSGYIQDYKFNKGESVGAGMPVVSFYNNSNAEVEVNIPYSIFKREKEIDSYTCQIDDKKVNLHLLTIAPKANLNQLYTMRLKLVDDIQAVAGTLTNVQIRYHSGNKLLTVPLTAILNENGRTFVWLYENGYVRQQGVKLDQILADGRALISGDIQPNDLVVSGGVNSLKDSIAVRPLTPNSKTNIGGML